MGLGKKILGIVFESDQATKDATEGAAPAAERAGSPGDVTRTDAPSPANAVTGTPSTGGLSVDELERGIHDAVERADAFVPYVTFAANLKLLESVGNPHERYTAALSVTKLPLDAVVAALNSHKGTLGAEKARFEQDFVVPSQAGIDSLKDKGTALQGEIDALNRQVAEKIAAREENARQIADATSTLSARRIDFDTASASAARYYDDLVRALASNLGGTANGQ